MPRSLNRLIANILILCLLGLGLPVRAHAGIIPTEQLAAVQAAPPSAGRDRIKGFLDRAEVRAYLQSQAIDAETARARVDALTDDEVNSIAGRMEQLPAGGDGVGTVLGFILVVFVILLITDILGFTKVFPFTRSVK